MRKTFQPERGDGVLVLSEDDSFPLGDKSIADPSRWMVGLHDPPMLSV